VIDALAAIYRAHALAVTFAAFTLGVVVAVHGLVIPCAWALACAACAAPLPLWRESAVRSTAALIACGFAAGATGASIAEHRSLDLPFKSLAERYVVAQVVAIERPRATSSGQSVRARVLRVVEPSGLAATALQGEVALVDFPARSDGDRIAGHLLRIRGRVSLPSGSRNEGEQAQRDILAEQGVSALIAVPTQRAMVVGSEAPGSEAWWARLRLRCAKSVEQRLPPLEATVLEGILWGDRGNLPASLRHEFSDTGTVHVLTTAGLHLGIFAALVAGMLSCLPLPRALRASLVVTAAWGYAALAGLHLPTVRAATMLTAGSLAQESGRGRSPSAVLAAAGFAVALPHPLVVLSPSFAMSFSCVAGIALLSPALTAAGLREGGGLPRAFVELLRTSLAVQIAMWPLQALYFNAFTPYAVLANMVVVPLVGIVMALGAGIVCAGAWLPFLAAPFANLAWWCLSLLIGAVDKFASLPHAHVDVPPPTHVFLVLYWILLGILAWWARDSRRNRVIFRRSAPYAAALVLAYCFPGIAAALDRSLHFDAIDVGQADCFLIRAPGMHAMLVDGGGKLERNGIRGAVIAQPLGDAIATHTVMPFLLRHWVLHLDYVVLTHPHGDHAGGLPVILERERAGVLYDSAQLYGGPAYQRALDVVRERHIAWRKALRGEAFDLGPTTHVKILAPELPLITGSPSDINNNSVVLRVAFGRTSILMTGDAQAEAESRLLAHGADLRADILKVGHHGSAYSSTPAIISCGLHNVFGHPSPRTLAALQAAGATVYRTDLDGGISIETNGETWIR
jgi:competence protein ComEC